MTANYYSIDTNAETGEQVITPYTPEQIAEVEALLAKAQVPESITRRQCAMQMFAGGMITDAEGIAMTQSGVPPAAVQAYLDTLPEPQRTMATMDFAATNYFRNNPLLAALMTLNNMTENDVDQFFIAASQR